MTRWLPQSGYLGLLHKIFATKLLGNYIQMFVCLFVEPKCWDFDCYSSATYTWAITAKCMAWLPCISARSVKPLVLRRFKSQCNLFCLYIAIVEQRSVLNVWPYIKVVESSRLDTQMCYVHRALDSCNTKLKLSLGSGIFARVLQVVSHS